MQKNGIIDVDDSDLPYKARSQNRIVVGTAAVRFCGCFFGLKHSSTSPLSGRKPVCMSDCGSKKDEQLSLLVQRAKKNDEAAFSQLFTQYTPLIDSICARYLSEAPSDQELRSEVMDAFWSAVQAYNTEQQTVTFGLYTRICIENRLVSAMRKWKRFPPPLSLQSNELFDLGADESSNPASYVLAQENYSELCCIIRESLSEKERRIWMLFMEGQTTGEIAGRLGISKKDVDNAIFRARKKLKQKIPPH